MSEIQETTFNEYLKDICDTQFKISKVLQCVLLFYSYT